MSDLYDYSRWKNFTRKELVCRDTGDENPNVEAFTQLMDDVQYLRTWAGIPFDVSSGYRALLHHIEAAKIALGIRPGEHTRAAIDFQVPTSHCHRIVKKAFEMGFTGIGINLTGEHGKRFIHLDERKSPPMIWSY